MNARSIILRTEQIRELALSAIMNLPVDDEHPLEILIRPYKAKRRNEANSMYWKRLSEISEQCWIGGRKFSAEVLHEYAKREYLPDECAKGIPKWAFLPSGDRELIMSTTDLNTSEFYDYLTQVEVWGADLGVMFSENRKAA